MPLVSTLAVLFVESDLAMSILLPSFHFAPGNTKDLRHANHIKLSCHPLTSLLLENKQPLYNNDHSENSNHASVGNVNISTSTDPYRWITFN